MLKIKLNKTLIKYRSLAAVLSVFVLLIAFFAKADSVSFYKTNILQVSDEINIHSLSPLGLEGGSVVSASCGVPSQPWRPCSACNKCGMCNQGQTQCTKTPPTWCTAFPPNDSLCPVTSCANGATNAPTCTYCPAGKTMVNGQCVNACANGATNAPACTTCPSGQSMVGGVCAGTCTNGAINPGLCNVCQTPRYYWNGSSCVANPCGATIPPANYAQSCAGPKNSCGQQSSGLIQCNGTCSAAVPNNNGCIQTFTPNTTSVQPNGSVEFFYKLLPIASDTSRTCGFYDRSQSKGPDGLGVPIPGLQNLSADSDRIRINNIQRNTEFCLVCRFTTSDGTPQAPAANHQWVRVIRIGEN
jgi:hypothetical protein